MAERPRSKSASPPSRRRERKRLESIAGRSLYAVGTGSATILHSLRIFARYIEPGPILEMGPAEGIMTGYLSALGHELTLVEGSSTFCRALRKEHPRATVVCSLFEDFQPSERFQTVILGHVLEHVESPAALLQQTSQWLRPGGRILAAVPNARSLHRQAAVLMGLMPHEEAQSELDRHHGHRRVFNPESFRRVFVEAGLEIEVFGGYWLKPLANHQIEADWTPQMLSAFLHLGERYPDIAAEIYLVARRRSDGGASRRKLAWPPLKAAAPRAAGVKTAG